VKCHLKLHIDITLHYVEVAAVAAVGGSGAGQASKPNNASAILSSVFLRRVSRRRPHYEPADDWSRE